MTDTLPIATGGATTRPAALYARAERAIDDLIREVAQAGCVSPAEAVKIVHRAAALKLRSILGDDGAAGKLREVAREIDR